jgi:hypothetical protein
MLNGARGSCQARHGDLRWSAVSRCAETPGAVNDERQDSALQHTMVVSSSDGKARRGAAVSISDAMNGQKWWEQGDGRGGRSDGASRAEGEEGKARRGPAAGEGDMGE